ncbi:Fic/DOC family protein [Microbacterium sp.]|uniref:Fic/DOC family protein n=1 Tax=Microbacterium sp. TaxID=51671 RepID=UPI0039E5F14C
MTEFVDPYVDPETGVLKNLVGARSKAELERIEADLSKARLIDLANARIKATRDLVEFRAIHRYLFQDVFGWAGELRTVDIRKNVEGGEYFVPVSMIERAAHFTFTQLAEDDHLKGMSRGRFIERLAHHYDQLNYVHPFREGNGRAQRAFWNSVALAAGQELDWTSTTGEVNDAASRRAAEKQDHSLLIAMLDQVVSR